MTLDLPKFGGPAGTNKALPVSTSAPAPTGGLTLPTFDTLGGGATGVKGFMGETSDEHARPGDLPWDTVGRAIFGTAEEGGVIGQIPIVGDIARVPGNIWSGVAAAGGWGIGQTVQAGAEVLGRITTNIKNPNASKIDVNRYAPTPQDAVRLIMDVKKDTGGTNISAQFMLLGRWQQKNDPEAFKAWQESLAEAQKQTGIGSKAGDILGGYVRQWGSIYADLTPEGVTGILDTMPELTFTNGGSVGGQFSDALRQLFILQTKVERGAAANKSDILGALQGKHVAGRLDEIVAMDPSKRTPIEQQAVDGLLELDWTPMHAMNFLLSKGQGYSSDPVTQMVLGFALDPLLVGSLGAALPAKIAARVAMYANTAESVSRITNAYRAGARLIGTTVADVRAGQLGPAFKVARTLWDPLSAFGGGPHARAKVDVFAAAGLKATEQGFGRSAVLSARRLAKQWDITEVFDSALGGSAMNLMRKWTASSFVENLNRFADVPVRRIISEDIIQATGKAAGKDAVSRAAGYVSRVKQFWLNTAGREQLAERMAKMGNRPIEEARAAISKMTDDERALWHQNTYTYADREFHEALARIPPQEWGPLSPKLRELTLLNPHQLDAVAAQVLSQALTDAKTLTARIKLWNEAADKYTVIEDIGRVNAEASKAMASRLDDLTRIIEDGHLHTALGVEEMSGVPQQFKNEFLGRWMDSEGQPIWRLGFKPVAEQATGMMYGADGGLIARFEPNIENVVDAIPVSPLRSTPILDALGRVLPEQVTTAVARGRDSLDVLLSTATDAVSGERIRINIQQSFRKQMRAAGFSDKVAQDVFRVSWKTAQEGGSITLAGLTPTEFWAASEPYLKGLVDARVAKSDIFAMLAKAAGGDLRLLGLSSGTTQRLRAAMIAKGLDPENYLGLVTVKLYNFTRYALNPMFFLQAVSDAPFFGMYRGLLPVGGGKLKPGSALYEMGRITKAMGNSSIANDLKMDFIERSTIIGWQQDVVSRLSGMPGVKEGIGRRAKDWTGRMILNNELQFMNSEIGASVMDALATTKKATLAKAASIVNPEEAALWTRELDQVPMFDYLHEEASKFYGRVATDDEVGRWYVSEMVEDSRLEVRTPEGLLDYTRVNAKGMYHKPTTVGALGSLDLNYLAEAVAWPNVHTKADLRAAISTAGPRNVGELRDVMKGLGMHPDHIDRAAAALTFNWRTYFDGLRHDLGMSRFEMQGLEDMVAKSARTVDMDPIEYITQVMPLAAKGVTDGLGGSMKFALNAMRLAGKGEAGLEEMAQLVAANLHPSGKQALLDSFIMRITGKDGLIETAMAAGRTAEAQDLNRVLEDLRGGWGQTAESEFRDLVVRRAGGEAILDPDVERVVRYFSKWMQEVGPSLQAGEVLKDIISKLPIEGASPYHFTQDLFLSTVADSMRIAEKDAIRLANMQTERTVLDRSLNHPMFALYPTSYFYGKVIPETIRFLAKPFGINTTVGLESFVKVKQTVELQTLYDDRMSELWDSFGKSAVVGLLSYISPGMPWEDMRVSLPPWVRALGKNGIDFSKMTQAEFATFSPERWVKRFFEAGAEIGDVVGGAVGGLTGGEQQGLQDISQTSVGFGVAASVSPVSGPVQGMELTPVLQDAMSQLQDAFK